MMSWVQFHALELDSIEKSLSIHMITLDFGGRLFHVPRNMLRNSNFFKTLMEIHRDNSTPISIHRDASVFADILQFEDGMYRHILCEKTPIERKRMVDEVRYYDLESSSNIIALFERCDIIAWEKDFHERIGETDDRGFKAVFDRFVEDIVSPEVSNVIARLLLSQAEIYFDKWKETGNMKLFRWLHDPDLYELEYVCDQVRKTKHLLIRLNKLADSVVPREDEAIMGGIRSLFAGDVYRTDEGVLFLFGVTVEQVSAHLDDWELDGYEAGLRDLFEWMRDPAQKYDLFVEENIPDSNGSRYR